MAIPAFLFTKTSPLRRLASFLTATLWTKQYSLRVESGGIALLCNVRPLPPYHETTDIKYCFFPPSSLTSDRMWGVRSFKGSECEQNVWNSQWSILDRDLLKSHLLDMFPWRMHFSIGEGLEQSSCILQWQNVEEINSFSVSISRWMSLVAVLIKLCSLKE